MEFVIGTGAGESGVGVNLVCCSGNLDLETVDEFKHRVLPLLAIGAPTLIIDLSEVGFMDSTGLGGLITALKRARQAEIELELVVNTERVVQLLALTGVDILFPIYESQQLALASN
jgi:anti-sigma B factor antagonist